MRRTTRRGGWLLLEAVLLLSLLAVFALLASELFIALARIERDTRTSQMLATQFDSMLGRLRADVWQAKTMDSPEPNTLVLTVDDQAVAWRFGDGVTRSSGDQTQNWPELTMPYAVEATTTHAVLSVGRHVAADARPAAFVLISQALDAEAQQ